MISAVRERSEECDGGGVVRVVLSLLGEMPVKAEVVLDSPLEGRSVWREQSVCP